MFISSSVSWGVSTAVGSSKTRTLASWVSVDDLHALLHADRKVLDQGIGIDVEAEPRRDLADLLTGGVEVEGAAKRVVS